MEITNMWTNSKFAFALLFLTFVASSCRSRDFNRSSADPKSASPTGSEGAGGSIRRADFAACPTPLGSFEGVDVTCAKFRVPLRWNPTTDKPIDYFVRRVSSRKVVPLTTQLWLLAGGPGSPGESLIGFAVAVANILPDIEVFVPDHRGVGNSTRLGCSAEGVNTPGRLAITPMERKGCVDEVVARWAGNLAAFGVTNMAHDVAESMKALRLPEQKLFAYGVSFGSYLTQRLLVVEPTLLSGAILDGICPAGICYVKNQEEWIDAGAKELMAFCAKDAVCTGKLGPDPFAALARALGMASDGTCKAYPPAASEDYRQLVTNMLKNPTGWNAAAFFTHRVRRCNALDKIFVEKLFTVFLPRLPSQATAVDETMPPYMDPEKIPLLTYSGILQDVVFASELWAPKPWAGAKISAREKLVIGNEDSSDRERMLALYPSMQEDAFAHKYPKTSTPILMINGTHDILTPLPLAREAGRALAGPGRTFVEMLYGPHGAINNTFARSNPEIPCGYLILGFFLREPSATLDTSCARDIIPVDYSGDDAALQKALGLDGNLWG